MSREGKFSVMELAECPRMTRRQHATNSRADRKGLSMTDVDPGLDRRIVFAYQQVKKARADGEYAAIIIWMRRVDELLDERMSRSRPVPPDQCAA